ncbi:MAG: hypothetical protein HYY37_01215 [Candidatus Aenigmarchaeota archaeon]|nr:hypothetical protein [Candidatus Aenigmarchaeota archaeon]
MKPGKPGRESIWHSIALALILVLLVLVGVFLINQNTMPAAGGPDISCAADEDCRLEVPEALLQCLPCDPYNCAFIDAGSAAVIAVNTAWGPSCPPREPQMCIQCIGGIEMNGYTAKCVNGQCVKLKG